MNLPEIGKLLERGEGKPLGFNESQNWPTKRLRFLVKRITSDHRTSLAGVDEVVFLSMDAIGTHGSLDLSVTRRVDDVRSGYTQLANGDVVVAKITPCFENGKGALIQGMAGGIGFGTTELHVLKPGPDLDGRYLYYVTVDPRFRKLGEEWMFGAAGQQRVPEDFVRDYRIAVPPLSQQRAIAEYLDREMARLDTLVAETSGLLELLSEKRSALIASVITGKKSVGSLSKSHDNIERSQDGPTKRLRFLVKRITSDDRTPSIWVDEIAFLAMDAIGTHGSLDLSVTRRIDDVRSGYTKLANGDVVVAKITPCFENGKGALIQGMAGGVGFGTTELHVLKPGPDLDGRYLYYVTVDPRFRKLGEAWMFGAAGQQRVPEDFVRDYRVAVPPLSLQRAIAEYLDRETARLDSLVAETSGLLELLSEKRAALIAAVIAGKKTVGDVA